MDYSYIGKLGSTHGLHGQLHIQHQLKGKNTFKKLKHIFIELKPESYIPYFIEQCNILGEEEAVVQLDETDSLETAKLLVGKNIYIETDLFQKLQPAELTMNFSGFKLYDAQNSLIGTIETVIEMPSQLLAQLFIKDQEVLIPIIEHMILDINMQQKSLKIAIPDGLLDVYLS